MTIKSLKRRLERAELLADGRITQTREGYHGLRRQWREAWTPGRIVVAGLLAGFAAGRSAPERAVKQLGRIGKQIGDPRWLRLVSSITGLLTSIQATVAAARAKDAAQTADEAAETADDAAGDAQQANQNAAAGAGPAAASATAAAGMAEPAARPAEGMEGGAPAAAGGGAQPARAVPPHGAAAASPAPQDRRRPDQSWDSQPPPAEAATDVSER